MLQTKLKCLYDFEYTTGRQKKMYASHAPTILVNQIKLTNIPMGLTLW